MDSSINGALKQLNRSYRCFNHNGKALTKTQVKAILEYGVKKGYKTTSQITDDDIANSQQL